MKVKDANSANPRGLCIHGVCMQRQAGRSRTCKCFPADAAAQLGPRRQHTVRRAAQQAARVNLRVGRGQPAVCLNRHCK